MWYCIVLKLIKDCCEHLVRVPCKALSTTFLACWLETKTARLLLLSLTSLCPSWHHHSPAFLRDPGGIRCNWASVASSVLAVNRVIHSGYRIFITIAWSEAFSAGHIIRVYSMLAQGELPGGASHKCHVQLLHTKEVGAFIYVWKSNTHYLRFIFPAAPGCLRLHCLTPGRENMDKVEGKGLPLGSQRLPPEVPAADSHSPHWKSSQGLTKWWLKRLYKTECEP